MLAEDKGYPICVFDLGYQYDFNGQMFTSCFQYALNEAIVKALESNGITPEQTDNLVLSTIGDNLDAIAFELLKDVWDFINGKSIIIDDVTKIKDGKMNNWLYRLEYVYSPNEFASGCGIKSYASPENEKYDSIFEKMFDDNKFELFVDGINKWLGKKGDDF